MPRRGRGRLAAGRRERGVVLAVTLVLLLGITLLSLASLRSAITELIMASYEEAHISARQKALAGAEAAAQRAENFVLDENTGDAYCTPGLTAVWPEVLCTIEAVDFPPTFLAGADASATHVRIRRIPPLWSDCPPLRDDPGECAAADYASFSVEGRYAAPDARGGRAVFVQGYTVTVADTVVTDIAPTFQYWPESSFVR